MIRRAVTLLAVAVFALSGQSLWGEDAAAKPAAPVAAPDTASPAPAAANGASHHQDADLAARVELLEKKVALLERSNKALTDIVDNQNLMLRDAVTGRQGPSGGKYYVPNVQAIRADSDSRRELVDTIVHDITRNSGELRVRNDMNTGQSLLINGVDTYYIPPRSSRTIAVASGTATTELAGEGTKSWMIGAPNYYQDIVIAPAVRTMIAANWQFDPSTGVWWRSVP